MFKKVGFKLIFVVSITTLLIISVYSYFNIRSQTNMLLSEVDRHANQLSEAVKNGTRYDMLFNQRERIHQIINTIGRGSDIKAVRILNKEGVVMYSSDSTFVGQMVNKRAEACYACHAADKPLERISIEERTRIFRIHPDSGRVYGIINPIYNEPSCWTADCHAHPKSATVLGVLDVTMSLEQVDGEILESEITELIFAIISVVSIGIIIGVFVKKWVDKPVKELVHGTNRVASGELNYTIKHTGKDELGVLANSFNNMTKKLNEMRLQLFQSEKLASIGQLAAGVAHEINNPLTGVLTYSSFLLKRTKDNPEIQEDLNVIVRETKRSREIVKSLLDFSRQSTPKMSPADLNEIINKAEAVVLNKLKLNNIVLVKDFDAALPQITVDANQIQQVIINFLVNATDAIGPKGGKITIKTTEIELSPKGITQIKRAECPNGHNLIDDDHRIDGKPSIKLKVQYGSNIGFIHLDPMYGLGKNHFGIPVPKNKTIHIGCPECDVTMINKTEKCDKCGSEIYEVNIPGQGLLLGCARVNCNWQRWDYIDKAGKKRFAELSIADTGCGIDPENINKIFDPFFSTKGQKGTGLGLSVNWGIIDNHGGSIAVISKVGEGTMFKIRLPLEQKSV